MSIAPRYLIGDLDLTEWPFATEFGSSYGAPQNVAEIVVSMLQDGEIVASDRSSNRTLTFTVLIEQADMDALAEAEASLMMECERQRNTFTIDPGDGYGAETVFDIFRVQVEFVHDDTWEQQGYRRYSLTIPALPFPRSTTEVIDEALTSSSSPSTTVIASGSSATNWTGTQTVSSSGGMLQQTVGTVHTIGWALRDVYTAVSEFIYTPGAPLDFSSEVYAYYDFDRPLETPLSNDAVAQLLVDGVEMPRLAVIQQSDGLYRAWFVVSDVSVSVLTARVTTSHTTADDFFGPGPGSVTHKIKNVTATNQAPSASSTGRESVRTIEVRGSARTEGRLQISHETAGLGDVLVYTGPEGGAIPLRQWRTSGGSVTSDATTVSGSRETMGSDVVFNVPSSGMPRGAWALYLRPRLSSGSGPGVFSAAAATKLGSTVLGSQAVTSDSLALSSAYSVHPIGDFTLPVADVPDGSVATVQITIPAVGADVLYDQAWLFYVGEGAALTLVSCGDGTPAAGTVHSRLWLDSASLLRSTPAVWMGTQPDRSDAIFADVGSAVSSWGVHTFEPGTLSAYLVTTGATHAGLELAHPPRWHTHARNLS